MAPFDGGRGPHLPPGKRWRMDVSNKTGKKLSSTQYRHLQSTDTLHRRKEKDRASLDRVGPRRLKTRENRISNVPWHISFRLKSDHEEEEPVLLDSLKEIIELEDSSFQERFDPVEDELPFEAPSNRDKRFYEAGPMVRSAFVSGWLVRAWDANHLPCIDWSKLGIWGRLGTGGYADVLAGKIRGRTVAIKKFKSVYMGFRMHFAGEKNFPVALLHGMDAWSKLCDEASRLVRSRHPNICSVLGVCQWPPALVLELAERGSLRDCIKKHGMLELPTLCKLAEDITRAMEHLHGMQPPLVHRDLTSSNILVFSNWQAKVADLGMASHRVMEKLRDTGSYGAVPWMAPEVLSGSNEQDEKCDVFSFGVILWEMATGRIPWEGRNPFWVMNAVAREGARLSIPPDLPGWLQNMIHACWLHEPTKRPSFHDISATLACNA